MVSEIDIMPGGRNSLKPGQPRSTNINTVQTLLKANLGSTKEKAPKTGRTHSQLSNDSNNMSMKCTDEIDLTTHMEGY